MTNVLPHAAGQGIRSQVHPALQLLAADGVAMEGADGNTDGNDEKGIDGQGGDGHDP